MITARYGEPGAMDCRSDRLPDSFEPLLSCATGHRRDCDLRGARASPLAGAFATASSPGVAPSASAHRPQRHGDRRSYAPETVARSITPARRSSRIRSRAADRNSSWPIPALVQRATPRPHSPEVRHVPATHRARTRNRAVGCDLKIYSAKQELFFV